MRRNMKKWLLLLCAVMVIGLAGCADKNTHSTTGATDAVNNENDVNEERTSEKEVDYEEIDGVVYVNGEELSVEKLLEMVGEATSQYRYSKVKESYNTIYLDYVTRQLYLPDDRRLYIRAYDTVSNSYYSLSVRGNYCEIGKSRKDDKLYTSLMDVLTRDELQSNKSTYTIEIDKTSIPDKACYKLTVARNLSDKEYYYDCYVDTNTNLFVGYAIWNTDTAAEDYVIEEVFYSDEPFLKWKYEYEIPTVDWHEQVYQWYGYDVEEQKAEELESETTDVEVTEPEIIVPETEEVEMNETETIEIENDETETADTNVSEEEVVETEQNDESIEGYETTIVLYNEMFKGRKVSMCLPVKDTVTATDVYIYGRRINDSKGYLLIGGQVSMGAPKCEDAENILEFYSEQAFEEIDNLTSPSDFKMEITTKEEVVFNEHSMYKYVGVIKKKISADKEAASSFVAYATTAEDTSIYWMLLDYSDNQDQMELLEKQALLMAETYTIK